MGGRVFQPSESPRRRAARASLLALLGFICLAALVPFARASLDLGARIGVPFLWVPEAVLYPLTGLAAWLVWRRIDVGLERKRAALRRWGWQLLLSSLWPAALFGANSPALAILLLLLSLGALALTLAAFIRLQAGAALLLLPYLAWLGTTAYLAAGRFWPGAL